jgi:hypothetical protein
VTKFLGVIEKIEKKTKKNIWSKLSCKIKEFENKVQKLPNLPHYYEINDEIIDDNTFRRYIIDNLDGKNSMTSGNDQVIIEEKLLPGE